jgi:diguanylate cyclase (GGDEF)-like protein
VLAVGLVALQAVFAVQIGPLPGATLLQVVLPVVSLVLGLIAGFAGHVSYPRVQNLRVYLAGYSVGLHSVAIALFIGFSGLYADFVPAAPAALFQLILVVALFECYAYSLLPAFPTYRTTRIVTIAVLVFVAVLLSVVRLAPASFIWLSRLDPDGLSDWVPAAVAVVALGCVVLNAVLTPRSFYLRGAFSGLALLGLGSWILPDLLDLLGFGPVSSDVVALLYAATVPLFFVIAILFHVLARMEHRVSYDPLLQIYNRQYCNTILAEQSNVVTRPPISVLMIDIDHFKQVNDTYGHQAGDRILFAVSQEIQKQVVPEGILCRYGGEELIVFFPGMAGRAVVPLAERLRRAIEKLETVYRKHRIGVTISLGLAERNDPRNSLSTIVRAADKALYLAKENGRNQVRFVRLKGSR